MKEPHPNGLPYTAEVLFDTTRTVAGAAREQRAKRRYEVGLRAGCVRPVDFFLCLIALPLPGPLVSVQR